MKFLELAFILYNSDLFTELFSDKLLKFIWFPETCLLHSSISNMLSISLLRTNIVFICFQKDSWINSPGSTEIDLIFSSSIISNQDANGKLFHRTNFQLYTVKTYSFGIL